MRVLLIKEIQGFFSSLIGYIVIAVFLIINSLFMWVFPGDYNILDSGYASLDSLFTMAPWVFLFLVPAITMRSFSEEKKAGTMELLLTKPLTDLQIVLAKYFGALILVILSLLPTLVFYWSVFSLGNPPGNIDGGGTLGASLGLFFLAAIYVAIGIFASSLTDNQIIAFILSVLLSFIAYLGFDFLSSLPGVGSFDTFVLGLGINDHYKSISRGVIDSRDIFYYAIVIVFFLLITRFKLQSRHW
jgi:ABC-2 type transport system permease protein